jgi:exopolyphosphatase / guanosine-5'-triphosphate,3'-diphosphate pyrophosphatase
VPAVARATGVACRTADTAERIPRVRVAVIDVGSNSVRLLIASVQPGGDVRELHRERVYLRLGDDAYRLGRIGRRKLDTLAETAELYARQARAARVERLETIVTAPGRQASNAEELVDVLRDATSAPVVVLGADDEGRLAWEGAVAALPSATGVIGVVDLGGGSCEVAIGRAGTGPHWVRSREAGALRVTRAFLPSTRLSARDLASARAGVRELLEDLDPLQPDAAFAVGGTARAISKVIGQRFGRRKLEALADAIARDGASAVTTGRDISQSRSETLLAGTLVLAEVARLLDVKLEVGRGGLREGAALALVRVASAAA